MKRISLFITIILTTSLIAEEYVVVAVSGFRTIREKSDPLNIFSKEIDSSGEESGVWTYAPTQNDNPNIIKTVYLTHFSKRKEVQSVLELFEDEIGNCAEDRSLVLMVNSWGAILSQRVALKYKHKCGKLPKATYIIEAIAKPTFLSFTSNLLSDSCVNIYQTRSRLHGGPIKNCTNIHLDYSNKKYSNYDGHIDAEWEGAKMAKSDLLKLMNSNGETK